MKSSPRQYLGRISRNRAAVLAAIVVAGSLAGFAGTRLPSTPETQVSAACPEICVALRPDGMYPNELAVRTGEYVRFNSADGARHNLAPGDGAADNATKHEDHGLTGDMAEDAHHGGHDAAPHDHAGDFVSGEFGPDEAWRVQFNTPGTYRLHDHFNPKQSILVVVYEDKVSRAQ